MPRNTIRQAHGGLGEAVAARYLAGLGWQVVARQVRAGRDEVDVLAIDPGPPATLVVVEVRSRTSVRFGPPEASVDGAKLRRCYRALAILRLAGRLPDGTRLPALPWRVDLVAVDLDPTLAAGRGGPRIRHLRAVVLP